MKHDLLYQCRTRYLCFFFFFSIWPSHNSCITTPKKNSSIHMWDIQQTLLCLLETSHEPSQPFDNKSTLFFLLQTSHHCRRRHLSTLDINDVDSVRCAVMWLQRGHAVHSWVGQTVFVDDQLSILSPERIDRRALNGGSMSSLCGCPARRRRLRCILYQHFLHLETLSERISISVSRTTPSWSLGTESWGCTELCMYYM